MAGLAGGERAGPVRGAGRGITEPSFRAEGTSCPPCADGGKRLGKREGAVGGRWEVKGPLTGLAARKSWMLGIGLAGREGWEATAWEMAREDVGAEEEGTGGGAEDETEVDGGRRGGRLEAGEGFKASLRPGTAFAAALTIGDGRRGSLVAVVVECAGGGLGMNMLPGGRGCGKATRGAGVAPCVAAPPTPLDGPAPFVRGVATDAGVLLEAEGAVEGSPRFEEGRA